MWQLKRKFQDHLDIHQRSLVLSFRLEFRSTKYWWYNDNMREENGLSDDLNTDENIDSNI